MCDYEWIKQFYNLVIISKNIFINGKRNIKIFENKK